MKIIKNKLTRLVPVVGRLDGGDLGSGLGGSLDLLVLGSKLILFTLLQDIKRVSFFVKK